jgi:hypothetical protein
MGGEIERERQLGPDGKGCAMRFREDKAEDLARARTEVAAWREANPRGTQDELVEAVGPKFHKDYAVVLRGILFRFDLDDAHEVAGTAAGVEADR